MVKWKNSWLSICFYTRKKVYICGYRCVLYMEFTIFSAIYLITTVLSILVSVLAWQRRSVVGAKELSILTVSLSVCTYVLIFESASTTLDGKIFWSKVSYIGTVTIPVLYLLFVLRFTKLIRFCDLKAGWMLFIFPFITLMLAYTNEYHHLIWSHFAPVKEETNMTTYYHGVWFWTGYVMYSYILLLIATYYLLEFNRGNKNNKNLRKQGLLVNIAGLCPWFVSIFYILGINPIHGLDTTSISTTFSTLLFTVAILNGNFLNLVPIARETLVETLPVGIIALDNQDRIQDINQVARVFLGIHLKEVLGLTLSEVGVSDNRMLDAVMSPEWSIQVDNPEDMAFKSYRINKQPLKSLSGSRLIIINDVTEEMLRQKELTEAKMKAEESDNLKSAFLANMSHEIRTPMNSIMGFISILQEDDLTEKEKSEYLEIVRSNGDRLLATLNDIVDISKIESGQAFLNFSDFDINEILINSYSLFRQEADLKDLEFTRPSILLPDVSYIRTDREKLYSIVTNLIKNALKYTMRGFVKFDCSINDNELFFSIVDSGIGIPAAKRHTIFERFVQVDSNRKSTFEGAGLGLAITKGFVEMLGGTITVESEVDKGSTFYVRIPVEPGTESWEKNSKT